MAFFGLDFEEGFIVGGDFEGDLAVLVLDVEAGVVVDSGEDSASGEGVKKGVGVATRDEDAFFCEAVFIVPFDGDAVG